MSNSARRMPAEWEPHDATWIAWPHHEPDWPGKLEAIEWVYTEIVRVLGGSERVEILCHDESVLESARDYLERSAVPGGTYRLHQLATDRSWLRDSAPTAVRNGEQLEWIHWGFNAWAKYDNYGQDQAIPPFISSVTGIPAVRATRPDRPDQRLILEGGAIDTDGEGTLMVTEECLLSQQQCRNPGLTREGYERAFAEYLGIRKTIWLERGCAGDDTHGHIDDIARFVAPATVLLAYEADSADENAACSRENLRRLQASADAAGRPLRVLECPMPRAVFFEGQRLPASYANFYIGNKVVIVPTFNDPHDAEVLGMLMECFPDREVVGICCRDLVWGLGTLHCLSQQQPAPLP